MANPNKDKRSNRTAKLESKPNDIREKSYLTKQVDSSITILDSPEADVVLEALLYLSKYADLQLNHLSYLQQKGILQKLLKLFNRNICILRMSLRLISILLTVEGVLLELDQDIYDEQILKIADMYMTHNDRHVKLFSLSIISKLAASCRINCLIFKVELFTPILETIKTSNDLELLECCLELLIKLLNVPAAYGVLADIENFQVPVFLKLLDNTEKKLAHLSYDVFEKISYYCLDVFQKMFKEAKLIQKLFEVIMDNEKQEFHEKAFNIIVNSLKSEETSHYFIETLEFLKFCQWVKTCDPKYLYPSITIVEHLTKIRSRRQILFDLSVEDSILFFLRSTDTSVLTKTCEAISNMTTHKYCCERMLTPIVLKELSQLLLRKDEEDRGYEAPLKTIFHFTRRNIVALDMIFAMGIHKVLLLYFKKGIGFISEESYLAVLEILYKMSLNPTQQQDIVSTSFFEKLFSLFQKSPNDIAVLVTEILVNFVSCAEFRRIFLSLNGPQICVGVLQTSDNFKLIRNVLIFIHSNLIYENMTRTFLQNNLVRVLKEYPENLKKKAPIIEKILSLIYNLVPPMKFFETNRLDIIDKLGSRFYLINGQWKASFPFLEILEATQVSPIYTIYVVDNTLELTKSEDAESIISETTSVSEQQIPEDKTIGFSNSGTCQVNYGKISSDPFLPRYIFHIAKYIDQAASMKEKVSILAKYVDTLLCGPKEGTTMVENVHNFKIHISSLKHRLGTNIIPIGYLRMGFHCERALLFKAIADRCCVPTSMVKGNNKLYWNEVALFSDANSNTLKLYVVDLMNNVGNLLMVGSRMANQYCNLTS